jgi:hypothetical protein
MDASYKVLFKQVTGIISPVLHGLISAAGSANAVLRDWKKATNATSAGGIRGIARVCMAIEIWRVVGISLPLGLKFAGLISGRELSRVIIYYFLVLLLQAQGSFTHMSSPCLAS